jgi:hypothetical protein
MILTLCSLDKITLSPFSKQRFPEITTISTDRLEQYLTIQKRDAEDEELFRKSIEGGTDSIPEINIPTKRSKSANAWVRRVKKKSKTNIISPENVKSTTIDDVNIDQVQSCKSGTAYRTMREIDIDNVPFKRNYRPKVEMWPEFLITEKKKWQMKRAQLVA